jgi:hypothetical protein
LPGWFATPTAWCWKEAYNFLKQFVLEQMRVESVKEFLTERTVDDIRQMALDYCHNGREN